MVRNAAEFKLSITRALTDQLEEALNRLSPEPLMLSALDALESRPGIYQLFHEEALVYVGKASASLPVRLSSHFWKVSGRTRIKIEDVSFACLYVDEDMDAVAPETQLIKRFRTAGAVPWNTNGFGNNDPGRERDTSAVKDKHFDALYPIDLDWPCAAVDLSMTTVAECLRQLKDELPYTFRYQTKRPRSPAPHPDCVAANVKVPKHDLPARDIFPLIVEALPDEWLITALPGYVIMYKERPKTYAAQIRQF